MKPRNSWEFVKFVVEVFVLPLFGFITYILNAISSVDNVNSFKDRPEYIYALEPPGYNKSDKVYVLSKMYCSTEYTEELVDFVNNIKTGYIIFLFVFLFIFCTCSFVVGTIAKIIKNFTDVESAGLKRVTLVGTIFTYLSFVFSVPVLYSSKVNYGNCLKIEGILTSYMNNTIFSLCNIGLWFLLTLAFYYSIRNYTNIKKYEKNVFVCIVLVIMWVYVVFFLVMALVIKFGSIWSFQLGWDISLSIDLTYGIVSLKFQDFTLGRIGASG